MVSSWKLVICLLLGAGAAAHAQGVAPAAPAPAPAAASPRPVAGPSASPVAGPSAAPVAGPNAAPVEPPSMAPGADLPTDFSRVAQARQAQASGQLIDVAREAAVAGCHDLGSEAASSQLDGLPGRAHLRVDLRKIGRARGASHVLYSDYRAGAIQREHGQFFDCSGDFVTAPPAPAVAAVVAEPPPRGAVGLQVELLPAGSLDFPDSGQSSNATHTEAATAFGVTGVVEWFASEGIALGFVPRAVFGIKPDGAGGESATQLDVRGRLRFGQLDRDGLALSGNITLGAAFLYLPDDFGSTSGALFGFGVGVTYPLRGRGFFSFDVGYQLSDQGTATPSGPFVPGTEVGLSTKLLHVGIGFGSYL